MVTTKTATFIGHDGPIYTLEKGFESHSFFSGGSDRIVSLWYYDKPQAPIGIVTTNSVIYSLRLLEDKLILLIGVAGGGFHVIDLRQKKETRYIVHHANGIFDIAYLSTKNQFVTAGADGTMAVWSADDFSLLASYQLCKQKIRGLALNEDQSILAVACGDGEVRIFETETFSILKTFTAHKESANTVLFHPDGKRLFSGGKDAHLRSWNFATGNLLAEIPAHNYAIYSICFSPDLSLLATASRDKNIKLWNADDLSIVQRIDKLRLDAHTHSVNKIIWPEKNMLISAGDDKKIFQWNVAE